MRPHERLDVWKKGIEFVVTLYKATEAFPKEEKFGLTKQLRRAAFRYRQILLKEQDENQKRNLPISCQTLRDLQAKWKPNY
jgi:hypothetical protein